MSSSVLPELLAPAGCWASLKAAVANGADAVYFGVESLNARLRAENFRRDQLAEVMAWLHARGVKGFLTLNVLLFPDEISEAAGLLLDARAAGVDALIVQDIGLARLAQHLTPELALHGSTQMSITSAAGVAQAAELGCERVVLARELTLRDLERLQRQLQSRGLAMPLEVFVHGALCVAYSGQCLTSEALGQRSANRGECAQACRLPYQLVVDGQPRDLGEQRYLLSPQDLAAWDLLPELTAAGVASLKVEGRLKEPSYVAAVTAAYRQGLDRLRSTAQTPADATVLEELELSFSRGFSSGWLRGVNHRQLVHARWGKKRGPWLGRLEAIEAGDWLVLRSQRAIKPGDGVVLELPSSDPLQPPKELGGRVMQVTTRPRGRIGLRLGPGRVRLAGLRAGSPCWLTSDPQLERRWQRMAEQAVPPRRQRLALRVSGALDQPLQLQVLYAEGCPDATGLVVRSKPCLQAAQTAGLDAPRLQHQLERLGETPWQLDTLDIQLEGALFLPVAVLNQLRRELVDQLASCCKPQASSPAKAALALPAQLQQVLPQLLPQPTPATAAPSPALTVLVRDLDQLRALRDQAVYRVIADLEQPAELREAVAIGQGVWPGGVWLAGPRICRPDEAWTLEPLLRSRADGFLVRNADQLETLTPLAPCVGDFSLNVANPLSAAWFLERWGLERVTASYDLALNQLLGLLEGCPAARVEVTLHQHMPLFHMEHCLFCAFLSDGHDHTDCGRPCEQHTVVLRDRSGTDHPLRADLGCRNTLFNGRAQTAAEAIPALLQAGVRHLRLELLQDSPDDARRRVQLYQQALMGEISGHQVWRQEQLESRLGVTRGSLLQRRDETGLR